MGHSLYRRFDRLSISGRHRTGHRQSARRGGGDDFAAAAQGYDPGDRAVGPRCDRMGRARGRAVSGAGRHAIYEAHSPQELLRAQSAQLEVLHVYGYRLRPDRAQGGCAQDCDGAGPVQHSKHCHFSVVALGGEHYFFTAHRGLDEQGQESALLSLQFAWPRCAAVSQGNLAGRADCSSGNSGQRAGWPAAPRSLQRSQRGRWRHILWPGRKHRRLSR